MQPENNPLLSWQGGAEFDPTFRYRYRLWRQWDDRLPRVLFVMLNPSAADATRNDPTVRRCLGFARSWGFGSLEVANLFGFRTPHPEELRRALDPVGPENDEHLTRAAARASLVVLAWGNHGTLQDRDQAVLRLLSPLHPLHCLGLTRPGHPRHPLFCSAALQPLPYLRTEN